jgi:hypothetical protein
MIDVYCPRYEKDTLYSPQIEKNDNNNWICNVPSPNNKILEVVEFTGYNDKIIEHHTCQEKVRQGNFLSYMNDSDEESTNNLESAAALVEQIKQHNRLVGSPSSKSSQPFIKNSFEVLTEPLAL